MRKITEITESARQRLRIVGENNEQIDFTLTYRPTQQSWYFDMDYEGKRISSKRLTNSPNVLNQLRNSLPFGIMCVVQDGSEPYFIDDFTTDRVQLYLLNNEEKEQVTTGIIEARTT